MGKPREASARSADKVQWKRRFFKACRHGASPAKRADIQFKNGVIARHQLEQMRDWITMRACCSTSWGDDVWYRGKEYPPDGPAKTLMRTCLKCTKFVPPQYVGSHGICLDCWVSGLGIDVLVQMLSSQSVVTIYQVHPADRALVRRSKQLTHITHADRAERGEWGDFRPRQ